ncbi:MAG: FAD:protein FMN transferase [candidate division NC10 bacterium]|nr:FAD:protein FMN transferase [candidate division NC10 bacterium]MDE2322468.1 FAD:protein FMN transferase [candidate division NC10 bacterium]
MGTLLEITLYHEPREAGKRVLARCFQEARRLEEIFSAHDDDSDLNRLNRHAGLGPVEINLELWSALTIALSLGRETDGAIDITIGPLIDLWSAAEEQGIMPSPALVAKALNRTGISSVQLLPDGRVELRRAGMRLDLGGVGKGYAVDRLSAILAQEGVTSAFINFGRSSLTAIGSPPEQKHWPVLLRSDDGAPIGLAYLKDQYLGVSGSFGHSFEIGRVRLSHLINPQDGSPLRHPSLGVAAARTATEAEVLAKAIIILDEAQGFAVVSRFPDTEGLLARSNGRQVSTPGFVETIRFEASVTTSREGIG